MAKGKGLAIAALVVGAVVAAAGSGGGGGARPRQPQPRPGPDENEGVVPESIRRRVALALATFNPAVMRAEAAKLRKEGWIAQAESLEQRAAEIEAAQQPAGPTGAPAPPVPAPPVPAPPVPAPPAPSPPAPSPPKPPTPSPPKPPTPAPPVPAPPAPAPQYPAEPKEVPPSLRGVTLKVDPNKYDPRVILWQDRLVAMGVRVATHSDGYYGTKTASETKSAQRLVGLAQTGIADPPTITAAYRWKKPAATVPTPAPTPAPSGPPAAPRPPETLPKPPSSSGVPRELVGVTLTVDPNKYDPRVIVWQDRLVALGFRKATHSDGYYGTKTAGETKLLQQNKGLPQTGVADPTTINAAWGVAPPAAAVPTVPVGEVPAQLRNATLKQSSAYDARVVIWQDKLMAVGVRPKGTKSDGFYGPNTATQTKALQKARGLPQTGTADPVTIATAYDAPLLSYVAGDPDAMPMGFSPAIAVLGNPEDPTMLGYELEAHLRAVPDGAEDRDLVARFQRVHKLNDTGQYGPATAEALISIGVIPPPVRYWPTKKLMRAKTRYKTALREQARRDPARAQEWLHAAAQV